MPAQIKLSVPIVIAWLCTGAAFCTSGDCASADSIRLAVQKTGTVSRELDVARAPVGQAGRPPVGFVGASHADPELAHQLRMAGARTVVTSMFDLPGAIKDVVEACM
jgi:hypothetical protein